MVTVVDASVAVKWVVPEEGSDRAIALLARIRLPIAPLILPVEVSAALAKKSHREAMTDSDALGNLNIFRSHMVRIGLRLFDIDPLLDPALSISARHRHPLVDCLYIALAQREAAALATADRRMAGVAERVLGDGAVRAI